MLVIYLEVSLIETTYVNRGYILKVATGLLHASLVLLGM